MHADHYLDIVGLRYLYPWGEPAPDPLPIHLPPGGRARLDALSKAVSERDGFFDAAFDAREYEPDRRSRSASCVCASSGAATTSRHGAWSSTRPTASRLGLYRRTGPSASVEEAVRDADLLLVESALGLAAAIDDPERGHLTPEEAIELARHSGARTAILVHYGPARRPEMESCARRPARGSARRSTDSP